MITINVPNGTDPGVAQVLQPTDAGEKFTSIATFGIATSDDITPNRVGFAGLMNAELSSNINSSGETRVLIKVNLPYYAAKSISCGCDGTTVPSFAKAGTIGAHVVITLPRGFAKDYVSSVTAPGAKAQLNAVLGLLLNAMSGKQYSVDDKYAPVGRLVEAKGGLISGTPQDELGIFESDGLINRAVMGLRPAAPDKTYGFASAT